MTRDQFIDAGTIIRDKIFEVLGLRDDPTPSQIRLLLGFMQAMTDTLKAEIFESYPEVWTEAISAYAQLEEPPGDPA